MGFRCIKLQNPPLVHSLHGEFSNNSVHFLSGMALSCTIPGCKRGGTARSLEQPTQIIIDNSRTMWHAGIIHTYCLLLGGCYVYNSTINNPRKVIK